MRVSDFVINCFRNCNKKARFWKNFFLQIFQTFGNLEIDFGINLEKRF